MSYEKSMQIQMVEEISYIIDDLQCSWGMDIEDIVNNMDTDIYNRLKACIRNRIEIEGPGPIYK